jgi:histidinol-phosphatase
MHHTPELAAALEAAEAASAVIRSAYTRRFEVRLKADQTPVTDVDVAAEEAIRAVLHRHFPSYGFYGEETGRSGPGDTLWLVDPIDGTKAFVRGYPMFSTQIALWRNGRLELGVSCAPFYGELAYAQIGVGSWLNGRPLRVSEETRIERIALSAGNLKTLAGSSRWAAYGRLVQRVDRIRGYGDFLHYHLLAAGKIDAVLESDLNILDVAALAVIVEQAGGRFTTLEGAPIGLDTRSVLTANPILHDALLTALSAEVDASGL